MPGIRPGTPVARASVGHTFPARVRTVLDTAPEYVGAELIDGFFEREVELGTAGRNSQTDLMVVADVQSELAIIAVEGKAEESFVEVVSEWNNSPGKQHRPEHLCRTLELNPASVGELRYQLFHRTASAIYEAHRYRCRRHAGPFLQPDASLVRRLRPIRACNQEAGRVSGLLFAVAHHRSCELAVGVGQRLARVTGLCRSKCGEVHRDASGACKQRAFVLHARASLACRPQCTDALLCSGRRFDTPLWKALKPESHFRVKLLPWCLSAQNLAAGDVYCKPQPRGRTPLSRLDPRM